MNFICQYDKCSKHFTSSDWRRMYCSSSCATIVNNSKYPKRKKKTRVCVTCNQLFFVRKKTSRYCNSECHKNRPPIARFPKERACATCGKPFHQADFVKNCSPKCGKEYRYKRWIKKWLANEVNGSVGKKHNGAKPRVKQYIRERDKYTCVLCEQGKIWNGQNLTLHVDHIDGNNTNNRPENLRTVCPNCHTQTDTYCSKNKKQKS